MLPCGYCGLLAWLPSYWGPDSFLSWFLASFICTRSLFTQLGSVVSCLDCSWPVDF